MKKLIVFFLFSLISASTAFAETVTLSTYYPAPFGAYDRLRLVPRANPPVCNAGLEGLIYFDANLQLLQVCTGGAFQNVSAVWTQNNIDAANADVYLTDPVRDINVGIGTTNPSVKLDVIGDMELAGSDTRFIRFRNAADSDHSSLGILNGGLALSGLSTVNNPPHVFVANSGNVGVGTVNPIDNLTVQGPGNANVVHRIDANDTNSHGSWLRLTESNFQGGFLRYDNASNDFHIGVHDNNNTNVAQDTVAITIDRGSGNVLVGGGALPGAPQPLNVRGGVMLRDDGANWGRLMVDFDGGTNGYYAVYAP